MCSALCGLAAAMGLAVLLCWKAMTALLLAFVLGVGTAAGAGAPAASTACGAPGQPPCSVCDNNAVLYEPENVCKACGNIGQFCCFSDTAGWRCDQGSCTILPNPFMDISGPQPYGLARVCQATGVISQAGATNAADCPAAWTQCGGQTYGGKPGCCAPGSDCTYFNNWWSQCIPGGKAQPPSPAVTPEPPAPVGDGDEDYDYDYEEPPVPETPPGTVVDTGTDEVKPLGGWKDGTTTRYWDCCKPSCAWPGKAKVTHPVYTCAADNSFIKDPMVKSGCVGGPGFKCAQQGPYIVNDDLAYGFVATGLQGQGEKDWCCSCYEFVFQEGAVAGKRMIVQATNTGSHYPSPNHFDMAIPGGGQGEFEGCFDQFPSFPGARYGGIEKKSQCKLLSKELRKGCKWRWKWFKDTQNPKVKFRPVECPSWHVKQTGCQRS